MSKQAMEAIIGRSLMDQDYRELFFANPEQALAGFDLTKEEQAALLSIDAETLDVFAKRLGVHMTRGGYQPQSRGLPPQP